MFQFLFKGVIVFVCLLILFAGLALWKGGEPFRWVGEMVQSGGRSIVHFGDFVDDVFSGNLRINKRHDAVMEVLEAEESGGRKRKE